MRVSFASNFRRNQRIHQGRGGGKTSSGLFSVMTPNFHVFGTLPDGREVQRFILKHPDGIEVELINYGATLMSLWVPDASGRRANIVLGYDSLEKYQRQNSYCGGIVGRFANRIHRGEFSLNGTRHRVTANEPPHHLHGGATGFDRQLWEVGPVSERSVTLEYLSPDGEEGYPGSVTARAIYTLTDAMTLRLDLTATTDQPTIVNLTSHAYFNMAGQGDILNHLLTIPADAYTPVDDRLIPTGEICSVAGSPFDFRTPTAIGARIQDDDPQLRYGHGYDHNFVLNPASDSNPALAARLSDPVSGRTMSIHSSHPGIQFYSGYFLSDTPVGRDGQHYFPHCALALEPQGFPDSPNHPHFPSAVITPEKPYRETIVYQFSNR